MSSCFLPFSRFPTCYEAQDGCRSHLHDRFRIDSALEFWQSGRWVHDFAEAQKTDARAHVVGTRAEDRPTHYDRSDNVFTFHMKDQTGAVHKVHYSGPKPANFQISLFVFYWGMGRRSVVLTPPHGRFPMLMRRTSAFFATVPVSAVPPPSSLWAPDSQTTPHHWI